jgi:hypothetical protein
MEYKDKEVFRNEESGKLDYDAYFESDKETLTRQDLYDIIDDLNESYYKENVIESIENLYSNCLHYFDFLEPDYPLYKDRIHQVYLYGKIVRICETAYLLIWKNYEHHLMYQYPEFLNDFKEIEDDFYSTLKDRAEKYNIYNEIIKDFKRYTIFDLITSRDITVILKKYTSCEEFKEYLDRTGTLYY